MCNLSQVMSFGPSVTQTCLSYIKFRRSIPFTLAQHNPLNYLCLQPPCRDFSSKLVKTRSSQGTALQTTSSWHQRSQAPQGCPCCIFHHWYGKVVRSVLVLPLLSPSPLNFPLCNGDRFILLERGRIHSPWAEEENDDRASVLTPGKHHSLHC